MKTNVICLVPVKNEAWIIRNFIECASTWADVIILLNHNSSDETLRIARAYSKVKVIHHCEQPFDEGLRRKLLWEEARKIPGRRLILAIDADEMISSNWMESPEWDLMLNAPPGTRFQFDWLEVQPGIEKAATFYQIAAVVDDDTEFQFGDVSIHTPRIPFTGSVVRHLKDIKLFHYVYIDPNRMFSKHRYLKCIEFLEVRKSPWNICITYQDTRVKTYDAPIVTIRKEWMSRYDWLDAYRSNDVVRQLYYWYDLEVLKYFDQYGVDRFRKLNIWDTDWQSKARALGKQGNYQDPRSKVEKWIHKFIERHREELKMRTTLRWKIINKFGLTILRMFGW